MRGRVALLAAALAVSGQEAFAQSGEKVSRLKRVLVYSKQGGTYLHESLPDGEKMLRDLGAARSFGVDIASGSQAFTAANLAKYDVVFFNNTCEVGETLDSAQRLAFQAWYAGGKGFVGSHCFSYHQDHWPWLADALRIGFKLHTHVQPGTAVLDPEGRRHEAALQEGRPVTALAETEEWYFWQATPRGTPGVEVTYTVNPATVTGEPAGADFPIAWYRAWQGGRFYYTAFGHPKEIYRSPAFVNHIHGALRQAAGYDIRGCMDRNSPAYDSTATLPGPCAPTALGRPHARGRRAAMGPRGSKTFATHDAAGRIVTASRREQP